MPEAVRSLVAELDASSCRTYWRDLLAELTHPRVFLEDGEVLPFLDAVERFSPRDPVIWTHQYRYIKGVMRFLHTGGLDKVLNAITDTRTDTRSDTRTDSVGCSDMEMGCLCAASAYCRLKVVHVPQLVDWGISEYDGLESIVMNS
ncbi:hypothetical protein HYH03_011069 [Edaphochlamys debaryana]|uniref:Uncharacterized protein n=1 Tax=Edaphochlamys debaryana TaxID=47281 RepID=A0A835XWR1_9CHLO|nr:hypothetical protein HYH03_011069 [Edaphochlamys debaryana]|eukprot:KAG2490433.1 hypothetical protein HYH03_011069 [Edaphochlamys debaryana]